MVSFVAGLRVLGSRGGCACLGPEGITRVDSSWRWDLVGYGRGLGFDLWISMVKGSLGRDLWGIENPRAETEKTEVNC